MNRRGETLLYVAGTVGQTATGVCDSLEAAMLLATQPHGIGGRMLSLQWVCEFIDDDPDLLRCTAMVTDRDEPVRLYVEAFVVEHYDALYEKYMQQDEPPTR